MSLVINALIGFANLSTVAVSGFMKVPQVLSLVKSKSALGVSLSSLLLEFTGYQVSDRTGAAATSAVLEDYGIITTIDKMNIIDGYCIMMSYNFYSNYPLASYFEYPLLVIQDLIMLLIMLNLLKLYSSTLIIPSIVFVALMLGIGWGYLPKMVVVVLVNLCTPLSASSKVVQLRSILSRKDSTGVSVTSWTISAYTCITRLFTTYVESFDVALLLNFFVSLLLNLAIVFAAKIYEPKKEVLAKKRD